MSTERLKSLCLRKVCSNLNLQWMICRRNFWIIPEKLGNEIFEYFFKKKCYPLNKNHIKFFYKGSICLTRIIINDRMHKYPNFFASMDKRKLREIYDSSSSKTEKDECLKNLLKSTKNIEKLFLDCSIDTTFYKDYLKNSFETVQEISLHGIDNKIKWLENFMTKFNHLIKVNLCSTSPMLALKDLSVSHALKNCTKTIKELTIYKVNLDFTNLVDFLNECSNLECFKLIDISNLYLPIHVIFENYSNTNNFIKTINLSKNSFMNINIIKDFSCLLNKFPKLENLFLDYSLSIAGHGDQRSDFEKWKNLKKLCLTGCKMCGFNAKSLGLHLSKLPNLINFDLSFAKVQQNSISLNKIFDGIIESKISLKHLNLENCSLGEINCQSLGKIFINSGKIEELNLDRNPNIGTLGMENLLRDAINSVFFLTYLSLDDCGLIEVHCVLIEQLLMKSKNLKIFSMNENKMIGGGLTNILVGLTDCRETLESFHLKDCDIDMEVIDHLIEFLEGFSWINTFINPIKTFKILVVNPPDHEIEIFFNLKSRVEHRYFLNHLQVLEGF